MATPTTATPSGSTPGALPFDTVLRGYERRQVDEYVTKATDEIAKLKDDLADSQRKRRLANEHAEATERELRDVRAKSAHSEPRSVEDSFGYRAEKLLRIAEQEAAEVRTHASRESAAIIEQARTARSRRPPPRRPSCAPRPTSSASATRPPRRSPAWTRCRATCARSWPGSTTCCRTSSRAVRGPSRASATAASRPPPTAAATAPPDPTGPTASAATASRAARSR